MNITSDVDHRVGGTTYPAARAPLDAVPLTDPRAAFAARVVERLARFAFHRLRIGRGDVIVVRGDVPVPVRVGMIRAVHSGAAGDPVVVFLPLDCRVHIERSRLDTEDRGYRETAVYGKDKAPERGVFTGVPDGRDTDTDTGATPTR